LAEGKLSEGDFRRGEKSRDLREVWEREKSEKKKKVWEREKKTREDVCGGGRGKREKKEFFFF
jgi:hypothetical protein